MKYKTQDRAARWGTLPALGGLLASLASIGALSALVLPGDPIISAPRTELEAPSTVQVAQATAHTSPALQLVQSLSSEHTPTWAAQVPVPAACTPPAATVSATWERDGAQVGVHVMPTGTARAALESLSSCSAPDTLNGAPARVTYLEGGLVLVWQVGDVLASWAGPAAKSSTAGGFDQQVRAALEPVCASLDLTVADASRNPASAEYEPYTRTIVVRPQPQDGYAEPADPGADDLPAPSDLEIPVMPEGVAGPALPEPVERPTPPAHPGKLTTHKQVQVPTADDVGPGCGWAFTGAVMPDQDPEQIDADTARIVADADKALLDAQLEWNSTVSEYLADVDTYVASLDAWERYATRVGKVSRSWTAQREAITAYQDALEMWERTTAERAALLAEQDAALVEHQDEKDACAAYDQALADWTKAQPADDADVSAPGGSEPVPPPHPCPATRPEVLDAEVPDPGNEPTPPELWTPKGAKT